MKGIDVSNNNGNINFSKVKSDGVECCYIKATEGTTFKDGYLYTNYCNANQNGLKVGFYHFLVGTSSPETQAHNFYNAIKDKSSDLIPMLDIEVNFDVLVDYVERFINRFKELSNMQIGIYTYTGFLSNLKGKFTEYPLWEANYNDNPWNLPSNSYTLVGHQYTEKGKVDGITGVCDVNEFNDGILLTSTKGEWIQDDTGYWYKHSDGSYVKCDWEKIDGEWYYFDYKGYRVTGWLHLTSNNQDYYFYSDGKMAHDCELWGTYKFDSNGVATKI